MRRGADERPNHESHTRAPDFEAGQLFERLVANGSGKISRQDFLKLYDKLKRSSDDEYYRRNRRGDTFDAGRIFERYDTDKTGSITKRDFVHFINDLQRTGGLRRGILNADVPLVERGSVLRSSRFLDREDFDRRVRHLDLSSPRHRHQDPLRRSFRSDLLQQPLDDLRYRPRAIETTSRPLRAHPLLHEARGTYVDGRDYEYTAGSTYGETGSPALHQRLINQLDRKMRLLTRQGQVVQTRMVDVQAACEAGEQETLDFFQPMIDRIRVAESKMLANLQHDMDDLNREAELINTYAQKIQDCEGNYTDLLRLVPLVNDVTERPFKRHFDEPTIRIPREAYECALALDERDSASSAIRTKDHMIWKLMKEKREDQDMVEAAKSESASISDRSAREVAKWKQMSNEFLEKLETCDDALQRKERLVRDQRRLLERLADHVANDEVDDAKDLLAEWKRSTSTSPTDRYRSRPRPQLVLPQPNNTSRNDAEDVDERRYEESIDIVPSSPDVASVVSESSKFASSRRPPRPRHEN